MQENAAVKTLSSYQNKGNIDSKDASEEKHYFISVHMAKRKDNSVDDQERQITHLWINNQLQCLENNSEVNLF